MLGETFLELFKNLFIYIYIIPREKRYFFYFFNHPNINIPKYYSINNFIKCKI